MAYHQLLRRKTGDLRSFYLHIPRGDLFQFQQNLSQSFYSGSFCVFSVFSDRCVFLLALFRIAGWLKFKYYSVCKLICNYEIYIYFFFKYYVCICFNYTVMINE